MVLIKEQSRFIRLMSKSLAEMLITFQHFILGQGVLSSVDLKKNEKELNIIELMEKSTCLLTID